MSDPSPVKYITTPKIDTYTSGKDTKLVLKGYHPAAFTLAKDLGGRPVTGVGMVYPGYRSYGLVLKEKFSEATWTEAAEALIALPDTPFQPVFEVPAHVQTSYEKLFPYQRQAVNFLYDQPKGALLALSPGLGKTAVSLTSAEVMGALNVLVVAPLSLLKTWEKECEQWTGRILERRYGKGPPEKAVMKERKENREGTWIVTNYDTLSRNKDYAMRVWDVLIIDESILVKNRKTKRFKALKDVSQFSKRVWLLSGSPTSKFADDLWSQLHLIDPLGWPSFWRFASRFCYLEESVWGNQIVGTRPEINFDDELADFLFVRNQKDVLPDLPEMRFEVMEVDLHLDQAKAHEELKEEFLARLDGEAEIIAPEKMVQMIRMQQVASNLMNLGPDTWNDSSGKADTIVELVVDDGVEYPMIIWTHWLPGAQSLRNKLVAVAPKLRIGMINGQQKATLNEILFERYKNGELDILILAMQVGRFGHTLTSTRTIVYMDKTWDADAYFQSLHRVKRIGLTHSPRVITLKAPGTVDDLVEQTLAGKLAAGAQVSNADLAMLLRSL